MDNRHPVRACSFVAIVMIHLVLTACASTDQKLANRGFEAIEDGQYVAAEKALTQALEANPDNPYALLNIGTVYQRTGRFNQARVMFEKVVALNPDDKPAKRSSFIPDSKTLKDIAEDNLKTLPAKQ